MKYQHKNYFGTDGIRGRVGEGAITPEFMMRLGYAAGRVLTSLDSNLAKGAHPAVLIGKDTRISGYMLEAALEAGLSAAGVNVLLTGPMPTPAVAYLTRALRAQAGIVISASHNPFDDNGIKFFSSLGTKLPDNIEYAIEAELDKPMKVMASAQLGKARRIDDAGGRYIEFCKSTFPHALDLRGFKIVLDCAHGATYHVAPPVFHELGAEVISIGNKPDGLNINEQVGSTHPEALQKAVLENNADLGIAFDGDGDRVMMVDSAGQLLEGDQLVYIIAAARHKSNRLQGGVVGTLMTNLALEHRFNTMRVPFARAKVGDRYVLELLNQHGWQLGGENSGHILTLDKHSSGDGIIAALQVLQALIESTEKGMDYRSSFRQLGSELKLYPQVLINVQTTKKVDLENNVFIQQTLSEAEQELSNKGRVLLRASGTESKIRVMVEGEHLLQVKRLAQKIADAVIEVTR